jgi:hypothetical protein
MYAFIDTRHHFWGYSTWRGNVSFEPIIKFSEYSVGIQQEGVNQAIPFGHHDLRAPKRHSQYYIPAR